MQALPLSLYVHFPWCVRKCPYCDFNSNQLAASLPETRYVEAVVDDLRHDLTDRETTELVSVFLGGGTPSLFSPGAVERLLSALAGHGLLSSRTEITLEANPGASDADRFRGYREAGVNRISIGVQSFNDVQLESRGRIHDAKAAVRAIERARDAGFDNLNIDLMFGLPGQGVEAGLADLDLGMSFEPTHLSYYQLTIEPNTLFHRFPPSLPDEEHIADLEEEGSQRLDAAGYRQYEVSAWAREGAICEHNLNYWQFGDYLGIGAGAHSKVTSEDRVSIQRVIKHKHPNAYLAASGSGAYVMSTRSVSSEERIFEFVLNGLGTEGWSFFGFIRGSNRSFQRSDTQCDRKRERTWSAAPQFSEPDGSGRAISR